DPAAISAELGLDRLLAINDFAAVSHAVAQLPDEFFIHLCGPDRPLPRDGVISVIGPGTGLGIGQLLRFGDGTYRVIETEGGHADFAPLDEVEDRILAYLRQRHHRVSVERILSGPGLANIAEALGAPIDPSIGTLSEREL